MKVIADIRSKLPATRDQGARPTCFAFAASTSHSSARAFQHHFSAEYLHQSASGEDFTKGLTPKKIFIALQDDGQPLEKFVPYNSTKINLPLCTIYQASGKSINFSKQIILDLLRADLAPILTLSLTFSFYKPDPGTNIVTEDGGQTLGKHAVIIAGLGMLAKDNYLLIGNSWGRKWGDNGYAWIALSYLKRHMYNIYILKKSGSYGSN